MRKDSETPATVPAPLPAPITLTVEEMRQVAAGTGALLGLTYSPFIICGGIRVPALTAVTAIAFM